MNIKDITSWTCWCNSVTFDNGGCRLCGKSPRYGNIDYEDLKQEAIKILKKNKEINTADWIEFFNIEEEFADAVLGLGEQQ